MGDEIPNYQPLVTAMGRPPLGQSLLLTLKPVLPDFWGLVMIADCRRLARLQGKSEESTDYAD